MQDGRNTLINTATIGILKVLREILLVRIKQLSFESSIRTECTNKLSFYATFGNLGLNLQISLELKPQKFELNPNI